MNRSTDGATANWSLERRVSLPWLVSTIGAAVAGIATAMITMVVVQNAVNALTESFKEQKVSNSNQFDRLNDKIEKVNSQLVENSTAKAAVDGAQSAKIESMNERLQTLSVEVSTLKGRADGYQTKR